MLTTNPFAGKIRVRVNAIIMNGDSVLLVKLHAPTSEHPFWMPPGGGLEVGETLEDGVKREVLEETGLEVTESQLWYITEYIKEPWHAIEFYYKCEVSHFDAVLGSDPELEVQYLQGIAWFNVFDTPSEPIKPPFLINQLRQDYQLKRSTPIFISSEHE
ncbi:NUDIX hydrolase [bacterium]|nr:MAG: NUDIX hydrolase [bacterium]